MVHSWCGWVLSKVRKKILVGPFGILRNVTMWCAGTGTTSSSAWWWRPGPGTCRQPSSSGGGREGRRSPVTGETSMRGRLAWPLLTGDTDTGTDTRDGARVTASLTRPRCPARPSGASVWTETAGTTHSRPPVTNSPLRASDFILFTTNRHI